MRALRVTLALAILSVACGGGGDPAGGRLVPQGDPDFAELEAPEQAGECSFDDECTVSCLFSCVPDEQGPTTCPDPPLEAPARVNGAGCLCSEDVCAYFE